MRERPIIMSAESVRATIAGRKTMTRRAVRPQPERDFAPIEIAELLTGIPLGQIRCPFPVGCRLWVKEGGVWCDIGFEQSVAYRADGEPDESWCRPVRWKSPIYMPRWASRLTLEIVSVRVERLQAISLDDAIAEAAGPGEHPCEDAIRYFVDAWDRLNAKRGYPWASNPWVWALTFRPLDPPPGRE